MPLKNGQTGYPSIDRPWLQYYSDEAINAPLPEGSMYDYMRACNVGRENATALTCGNRHISFLKFFADIDNCAKALDSYGVKAGDVVSAIMLASPEAVILLYAINKIGAVSCFLSPSSPEDTIRGQLSLLKSKLVVTHDIFQKIVLFAAEDSGVETVICVSLAAYLPVPASILARLKFQAPKGTERLISWKRFLENGMSTVLPLPTVSGDEDAVIEFTGGTTGEPKGVVISNTAANAVAFAYKTSTDTMDFQTGQRFLDILPPFLAYGIFFGAHMPLCVGLENILCPDPSPEKLPGLLVKYRPNHFSGGPLHMNQMISDKKMQKSDLSHIITAAYGGDNMNEEWEDSVSRFLKEHGAHNGIMKGYGMTETASTFCTSTHRTRYMIPFAKNNIRIMDLDSGNELGYGQEGEICLAGPSLMDRYFKNVQNKDDPFETIDGVRWLHTGDLGYVTENGAFTISGRLKRILWALGADRIPQRVYPMAIEKILCENPAVIQCVVVGRKNGERGFLPIAYIVNEATADRKALTTELLALSKSRLPDYSRPLEIHYLCEMPLTGAGKVDYRALERMAQS